MTKEDIIAKVNAIDGLAAWEDGNLVCIEKAGEKKQAVADAIEETPGFPRVLKWVRSDESAGLAWFTLA